MYTLPALPIAQVRVLIQGRYNSRLGSKHFFLGYRSEIDVKDTLTYKLKNLIAVAGCLVNLLISFTNSLSVNCYSLAISLLPLSQRLAHFSGIACVVLWHFLTNSDGFFVHVASVAH